MPANKPLGPHKTFLNIFANDFLVFQRTFLDTKSFGNMSAGEPQVFQSVEPLRSNLSKKKSKT